jgi:phage gpG-like protein
MITFKIKENLKPVIDAVQKARVALDERQPLMQRIKDRQIRRWATNFNSQGALYGAWPALSPFTLARRAREGSGSKMLVRTGRLVSWVTANNRAGVVDNQSVHWNFRFSGKDGSYAVFHNDGYYSVLYKAPVPARLIWDLNEQDENEIAELTEDYVDAVIARYF